MSIQIETVAQLQSDRVVIYQAHGKRKKSENDNLNGKEKHRFNGVMSKATASQCSKYLKNWFDVVEVRKLTFITLTLPSKQAHSDNELKRNALTHFITRIKNLGVRHYFWRAEAQKNGNIHFHIIADKYLDWSLVRSIWNGILENYGYIDEFEAKNGHRNPNSTDIHSLKKVKNVVDYILKYLTKSQLEEGYRTINGRIWGCSDGLRSTEVYKNTVGIEIIETKGSCSLANHEMIEFIKEAEKGAKKVFECSERKIKIIYLRTNIRNILKKYKIEFANYEKNRKNNFDILYQRN